MDNPFNIGDLIELSDLGKNSEFLLSQKWPATVTSVEDEYVRWGNRKTGYKFNRFKLATKPKKSAKVVDEFDLSKFA